jgi:hypothetical protein
VEVGQGMAARDREGSKRSQGWKVCLKGRELSKKLYQILSKIMMMTMRISFKMMIWTIAIFTQKKISKIFFTLRTTSHYI